MERPIIVVGSPRSGTSMTAGLLHHCGAWAGGCREANDWNPKGFFEHIAIGELRRKKQVTIEAVKHILRREGYPGGPWVYKCTPWGMEQWEVFNPRYVLVRRDIRKSFESWCRIHPDWDPGMMYEKLLAHNKILDRMNGITVQADNLIRYRMERIRLAESVGLKYSKEADEFVDVSLWH